MTAFKQSLHSGTPSISVHDNRGLTIRQILYHRHPDTPTLLDPRITRHRFDARGLPAMSIDPRLHERQQSVPDSKPNLLHHTALGGEVLRSESVDAGLTYQLNDVSGRALWSVAATGVTHRWLYEPAPLAGRLTAVEEQASAVAATLTQRLVWSDNGQRARDHNLAGLVARHYDTVGCNETGSMGLSGALLSQTRRLLPQGVDADWQGADETAWEALLAPQAYTTQSEADATGASLRQLDAQGHAQRHAYDIAGLLASSWLTLSQGSEQPILTSVQYAASGQALREEHGNGVVTTYHYEPRTQRLAGITTERPAGHASGARVLQDLRYAYDPVGNVLVVRNDAEATRFWHNLRVTPENHYTYDSLYQLVSASGRETLSNARRASSHPPAALPLPPHDTTLTPYTRSYDYDRGGNLTRIVHTAPPPGDSYTLRMTVSECSNRAVSAALTDDPAAVDGLFDASGNQLQLQPGQPLNWNLRSELGQVVQVARDAHTSDYETYRYDSVSQRVEKFASQQAGGASQTQRALYLPGLELRTRHTDATLVEDLQVITLAQSGRAQVRVLHWERGKPGGVTNDSVRYNHDDLIGSVGLQVDDSGHIISQEEYYPYGGTSVWTARNQVEAGYKTLRYSGKERDATGLYYYGYRYYLPWAGRWLSADPAGTVDGLNLYAMVLNNPVTLSDPSGLHASDDHYHKYVAVRDAAKLIKEAQEDVANFMASKSTVMVAAAVSNTFQEVVTSAFGALGSIAGAPGGPVGSLVAGSMAKDVAKKFAPAIAPSPKLDISKQIEQRSKSTGRKFMDSLKHYTDPTYVKEKAIDKGANKAIDKGLEAAGAVALPQSVPFVWFYKMFKSFKEAKSMDKGQLLNNFMTALDTAEATINSLDQDIRAAFETEGRILPDKHAHSTLYLPGAVAPPPERYIPVSEHPLKASGMIRSGQYDAYHKVTLAHIASSRQYAKSQMSLRLQKASDTSTRR